MYVCRGRGDECIYMSGCLTSNNYESFLILYLMCSPVHGVEGVCPGGNKPVVALPSVQQKPQVVHLHRHKPCGEETAWLD